MTIELYGYKIEPYEHGYTLSKKMTKKEGKRAGEEYWWDTVYPRDLLHALKMVREKVKSEPQRAELSDVIGTMVELDRKFIDDLKDALQSI